MRRRVVTALLVAVGACTTYDGPAGGRGLGDEHVCVDLDGDGFGRACTAGPDCDDHDRGVSSACPGCAEPDEGCGCEPGAAPVSCFLDKTVADDGVVMCHEGTRYCRAGAWSACEGVHSYARPESMSTALINPDAAPEHCNDCNVKCFIIRDNLDPVDGGLDGGSVQWGSGGGLTLGAVPDASWSPPPPDGGWGTGPIDNPDETVECVVGTAPDWDCDGIEDVFDPYPHEKPFETVNPAIFLDIAPGETGTGVVDLRFFLNSADIYFLLDQTGSMREERDQLKADLVTGDFINDPNFDCSDSDLDFEPNNELKSQGLIGAIRCLIRDTNFGVGFFREIPFSNYANSDHVAFANYQDITDDVGDVLDAVGRLDNIGNIDWEEGSMVALHNLITGNGMYFGITKRGIPPRQDCPMDHWGYPCFRPDTIPIVVMFTDAMMHNGPSNNAYAYSAGNLGLTKGTTANYTPLDVTNESFADPHDLGDLTNARLSYTGDTSMMADDLTSGVFSCSVASEAPDALFKFNLTQQKSVTIESTGSQFDTVLGLYTGVPGTAPMALSPSNNLNEANMTAQSLGALDGTWISIAGNTSAMASNYDWSAVGCNSNVASPDAVYTFSLGAPTRVAVSTVGSAFDTVVSLHDAAPPQAPTYTAVANTNDTLATAYNAGQVYDSVHAFSGDTSAPALASDVTLGCNADNTTSDAVFRFDLSSATRVRLSTEGSNFDTVLGLFDSNAANLTQIAVPNSNETQATKYDIGPLATHIFKLTGSTGSMAADYTTAQIGCGASSSGKDAVFDFSLAAPTDVLIDTVGTSWDTVLSLHNLNINPTTYVTTTNQNEKFTNAQNLGILNAKDFVVTGGNTNSMDADITGVGCNAADNSHDAVYEFSLSGFTRIRVDVTGSSFDTVLGLYGINPIPVDVVTAISNTNEAQASAYNAGTGGEATKQFTGNTLLMADNFNRVCGASSPDSKDSVFRFDVAQTSTYQIDTIGTSFDSVMFLYPSTIDEGTTTPTPVVLLNTNEAIASMYDVGTLDGQWKRYSGSTQNMANDLSFSSCTANSSSRDAVFHFTLATARTVTIDTDGSSFDTVLGLYRFPNAHPNHNSPVFVTCDDDSGTGGVVSKMANVALAAGHYYVIVKGGSSTARGAYQISFKDNAAPNLPTNMIQCDDDSGGGGAGSIVRSLTPGTYHVVVKGFGATAMGAYKLRVRDKSWFDTRNGLLTCSDTPDYVEMDLFSGSYQFVIKGDASGDDGSYALHVYDVTNPPGGSLACDDNGGGGTTSRISQNLPAGTYHVVLKGKASGNSGSYTLNIRDVAAPDTGTVVACDDDSGPDGASVVERDLGAGTHYAIIKGDGATDEGPYKLSLRDVTHQGFARLQCDDDGGGGTASYLERDLAAGTYHVVVKGDAAADKGNYTLGLRDVTAVPLTSAYCNDNGSTYNTSKLTQTLNAGTYYVALKGRTSGASGPYQLTLGGGSTSSGTYVPPTWAQTLAAVNAKDVRVMSILSCEDDPDHGNSSGDCNATRAQAVTLANATDALGANFQPLVFDIHSDGSGLSGAVLDGIAGLAGYVEMDVGIRVVFSPDANPGFGLNITAVDHPGDGCNGISGVQHLNCYPGATPTFHLEFTNPFNHPVPLNPNDPKGGYWFRADMIADGKYFVTALPIYIVPKDLDGSVPGTRPLLYGTGTYRQDITHHLGCQMNELPDWSNLTWSADLPKGTSIDFAACTADSAAGLNSCMLVPVASVAGSGSCTNDSMCGLGFCANNGVCQTITSSTCQNSSQCALGATCSSGTCVYPHQPVYVGPVLGATNLVPNLRMQITLHGNVAANDTPTLYDWALTYLCRGNL